MEYKQSIYLSHLLATDYPIVYQELCKALDESGVEHFFLPYSEEVWARDYMPVHIGQGDYLGFKFQPDYLWDKVDYRKYITEQSKATGNLPINYLRKIDAVLDGGNFVFCDDKMIMTDKIFSENPKIRHSTLINAIEEACQKELILLPWDMEEEFGHADGMVSYLGNGKVLLNNYCQMGKDGVAFSKRLHKILSPHFTVTELHYNDPREKNNALYLNYLETHTSVIIPALSENHDSKSDLAALEVFKKIFKKQIIQVYALPIINYGGALHCVTWEFYRKPTDEINV